jgi:hypothetical protein
MLKALKRAVPNCVAGTTDGHRPGLSQPPQPVKGLGSSSPAVQILSRLLAGALSLWFAGCTSPKPGSAARPAQNAPTEVKSVHEVAPTPNQPEPPARPVSPSPQLPQRINDPKPPPTTPSKGAEKLIALTTPLAARARENNPVNAEPVQRKAPAVTNPRAETDAPVKELVFKGTPPQTHTQLSPWKLLSWIGVGFGVGVLAVVVRLCLIRRAEPIKAKGDKKEDLMPAPGLLLKEPVSAAPETLVIRGS